ncbi:hypothetical protein DRN69_06685 [Candidatus Pacearchaeota archaeon]|nr:MAG: hypothetical protein DRN69_06685 [Candidatus Pacearchaeota archaeon]
MIKISIETKDTEKALRQVLNIIHQSIIASGRDAAFKIRDTARILAPQAGVAYTVSGKNVGKKYVRTGKLSNSINVYNDGQGIEVGNSILYYVYVYTGYEHWVEFGSNSYGGWSDSNYNHRWTTYPGANGGRGFMRLATEMTSLTVPELMKNRILNGFKGI